MFVIVLTIQRNILGTHKGNIFQIFPIVSSPKYHYLFACSLICILTVTYVEHHVLVIFLCECGV